MARIPGKQIKSFYNISGKIGSIRFNTHPNMGVNMHEKQLRRSGKVKLYKAFRAQDSRRRRGSTT